MKRFFAKKTACSFGHTHDSKSEASRCHDLHHLQSIGDIHHLRIAPAFEFVINGAPVKMANGHKMRFTADFEYWQDGRRVVEDVKPKGGFDNKSREVPIKLALLRHLHPDTDWRIYK